MNLQWFPGHMAKTKRMISEDIKLIDIVVEILDARLPMSSQNPEIDELTAGKPRLIILNKSDLSDDNANKLWINYFMAQKHRVILLDSIHAKNLNLIIAEIKDILKEKIEKQHEKGMVNRSIKIMVVGVPNVGKSSFINKLAGRASANVGDRPGVTRGKQWIRLKNGIELLDTPGILWPKFEDRQIGMRLAFTGAIKDEIMDTEELSVHLLEFLRDKYKEMLCARYKLEDIETMSGYELLEMIGRKRGFIISGGEIDTYRAANIILDEFRSGKIGKVTLEVPENADE